MSEIYKIRKWRDTKERFFAEGTLQELIRFFGYILEVGHELNKKVNKNPKTITSLIDNLNMAFNEKESSCYIRTYVDLVVEENCEFCGNKAKLYPKKVWSIGYDWKENNDTFQVCEKCLKEEEDED